MDLKKHYCNLAEDAIKLKRDALDGEYQIFLDRARKDITDSDVPYDSGDKLYSKLCVKLLNLDPDKIFEGDKYGMTAIATAFMLSIIFTVPFSGYVELANPSLELVISVTIIFAIFLIVASYAIAKLHQTFDLKSLAKCVATLEVLFRRKGKSTENIIRKAVKEGAKVAGSY